MNLKGKLAHVLKNQKIRGCDPKGCGGFHASRGGREHGGLDFVVTEGQDVFSPIAGKVTRFPYPYADDTKYKGIEIINETQKVKMFYVLATAKIGDTVRAGQKIASAQDISKKYGGGMTNHVHFEMYEHGKRIDPTNRF